MAVPDALRASLSDGTMAYRDDDEALAAEAMELQRELASVLAKCALPPSSTAQPTKRDEPAEARPDRLRREVASLRDQLREAESALAAQRGASRPHPQEVRRDLRLNDPFDLPTAQPASLS